MKNAAACLLEYVPGKEFIIQLPASPSRPALHDLYTYRSQIHPKTDCVRLVIHVGGVPVGDGPTVQKLCSEAASKFQAHLTRLVTCPLGATHKGTHHTRDFHLGPKRACIELPLNCSHPDLWGLVGTLLGSTFE